MPGKGDFGPYRRAITRGRIDQYDEPFAQDSVGTA